MNQKVLIELDLGEVKELLMEGLLHRGYRKVGEPQFAISINQPHWPEGFAASAAIDGVTVIAEQRGNHAP